jgi:DUF1680 family protein
MRAVAIAMIIDGLVLCGGACGQAPQHLEAACFPLSAVRLLDGELKHEQDAVLGYLRSEDLDALLFNFRRNAGLPAPGKPLGGWEAPDCELRGHYTGHFLSALALMYESTGDETLKERGAQLVAQLGKCQVALGNYGYLSAFPVSFVERLAHGEKVWAPWYTLHKIAAGLLDQHLRCGNAQALQIAVAFAGWVAAFTGPLDEAAMQRMLGTEFGGMPLFLADLYAVTRDPAHLALARRFTHHRVLDPLAEGRDELKGLHANTQIPKLIAAARLFELTGDQWFGNAARFFWETVTQHRCYATGGTSSYEYWRDEPDRLSWQLSSQDAENCCTHNLLKLTKLLWQQRPDSRYADYYERALWNGILGTRCPDDPAAFMYYVPMQSGLFRYYCSRDNGYVCCSGTGIESFSKLGDFVYAHSGDALYVNLFAPSEVDWAEKGVRLRQETKFPDEEKTVLVVAAKAPAKFALRVRRPVWCKEGFALAVNGSRLDANVGNDGYATFAREWRDGDRVEVTLPMAERTEPLGKGANLIAVLYGPILMAKELGDCGPGIGEEAYRRNVEGAAYGQEECNYAGLGRRTRPALRFETGETLRTGPESYVPFYRLRGHRYGIYLVENDQNLISPAEALAMAREFATDKLHDDRVVASITVGDEYQLFDNFQAWHSERGESNGQHWVRSDLWFRYDLDCSPKLANTLRLTFARDEDSKTFELSVDGVRVATEALEIPSGTEPFFTQDFALPPESTRGHSRVAIKIAVPPRAKDSGPPGLRRTPRLFALEMRRGP